MGAVAADGPGAGAGTGAGAGAALDVEGQAPWSLMPTPLMRPDLGQLGAASLQEYAVGS